MLNVQELIQSLVSAETPNPPQSTLDNAKGFANAYSNYLYKGSANGVAMNFAPLEAPLPQKTLLSGLVAAFSAKSPEAISLGIQVATLGFLNAGVAATLFPTALSFTVVTPLATLLVPSFPTPMGDRVAAKTKLAAQIHLWLTTGAQVVFPTPLGPFFFV